MLKCDLGITLVQMRLTQAYPQLCLSGLDAHGSALQPLPLHLPFDLSRHPSAQSELAGAMLTRMRGDMLAYAREWVWTCPLV